MQLIVDLLATLAHFFSCISCLVWSKHESYFLLHSLQTFKLNNGISLNDNCSQVLPFWIGAFFQHHIVEKASYPLEVPMTLRLTFNENWSCSFHVLFGNEPCASYSLFQLCDGDRSWPLRKSVCTSLLFSFARHLFLSRDRCEIGAPSGGLCMCITGHCWYLYRDAFVSAHRWHHRGYENIHICIHIYFPF